MQFQADVLGVPVVVAEIAETTALGAALLAGVGVGAWTQADVAERDGERARYEPRDGRGRARRAASTTGDAPSQRARGWAQG